MSEIVQLSDANQVALMRRFGITREELKIPDSEWYPMRDACFYQNNWSGSIRKGAVAFCEANQNTKYC